MLQGLPQSFLFIRKMDLKLLYTAYSGHHFLKIFQRPHYPLPGRDFTRPTFSRKSHNQGPTYISDLLELKKSNFSLRSANGINKARTTIEIEVLWGQSHLNLCSPTCTRNMLPNNVKTSPNLNIFKKHLKTYFFKIAFS